MIYTFSKLQVYLIDDMPDEKIIDIVYKRGIFALSNYTLFTKSIKHEGIEYYLIMEKYPVYNHNVVRGFEISLPFTYSKSVHSKDFYFDTFHDFPINTDDQEQVALIMDMIYEEKPIKEIKVSGKWFMKDRIIKII